MGMGDLAGELGAGVGAEEEAVRIAMRRLRVPLFPCRGVGIEDRPDRPAAVELSRVAAICHRGGEKLIRAVRLVPEPPARAVSQRPTLPTPFLFQTRPPVLRERGGPPQLFFPLH